MNREKIIDEMKPIEFRLRKYREFEELEVIKDKYDVEYLLIKQKDSEREGSYHYYILSKQLEVVGRFDIVIVENKCGISYHVIPEYQNRGIGSNALKTVVNRAFDEYENVELIRCLAVNDRSKKIAIKAGFVKKKTKSKYLFELKKAKN